MGKQADRDYSPGWRLFTKIVLPPLIGSIMKLKMTGKQNFPRKGGMIVAGNHLSYADWAAMCLFTYRSGHYPVFTIKSPVFNVKFIGRLLRGCGQIPVFRGRADAALMLKDAEQRISRGACVVFYPEGTASRDPQHWPMIARTGVARLALTTGAPVVPAACWGAQVILPYGDKKPRLFPRKTVQITAGPPVDLSAFEGLPLTAETLRAATTAIMTDVTKLLAGLRGEEAPAAFYNPRADRAVESGSADTTGADTTGADGTGADAAEADAAEADAAGADGTGADAAGPDEARKAQQG
jgi:1-acyl-sn-glycerol-3-phosphate acyltransferase